MESKADYFIQKSQIWLRKTVFPLWIAKGVDPANGSFVESIAADGKLTMAPRRAMVQARQIYSFAEAMKMNVIDDITGTQIIDRSTQFLLKNYSLPSDAFLHAVNIKGQPLHLQSELYTQAFVLFGLARAFAVLGQTEIKHRAKRLLKYLQTDRRAAFGGYTEIKHRDQVFYQSNPHMHLFEAAIAWMQVDKQDPTWVKLGTELFELCRDRFVDKETGLLAEHFNESWRPQKENERFIFEPGHHYEWAWLLFEFEKASRVSVGKLPFQLFDKAEVYGVRKPEGLVFDEVWSDFTVRKASSRFWPQCERIKAALTAGLSDPRSSLRRYIESADEAMQALWLYLDTAPAGHWQDTRSEGGEFVHQDTKASSLYHILCAMSEYITKRPLLESKAHAH